MRSPAPELVRKRPKDRADRIVAAAARLFRERGYHAVGIDEIGEAVGVTGPAVYRHFASKEALLLAAAERAASHAHRVLHEAGSPASTEPAAPSPRDALTALVRTAFELTLDDRDLAAVYLREARHIRRPAATRALERSNTALFVEALGRARPELPDDQTLFALRSIPGLASSVLRAPAALSRARLADLLTRMGVAALRAAPVLPPGRTGRTAGPTAERPVARRTSRREEILSAAVGLIREHGYRGVGMDDIGLAAGITGPGVYRHFGTKEEILAAAFNRANEHLAATIGTCLALSATAHEALERIVAAYVDVALPNADLVAVYMTEGHALSAERQAAIRRDRRAYVHEWVTLLAETRPAISESEARAMVAGVMGLVNGYAWGPRRLPLAPACAAVTAMATAALLDV